MCECAAKAIVLTSCSRLVNIAVGVFMVLGGISNFFTGTWSSIILGVYVLLFGLGLFRDTPHTTSLLTCLQLSVDLSSFLTSRTTLTVMPPSSSLSLVAVFVSDLQNQCITTGG